MDSLFIIKDKTINYQFLALDVESPDVLTTLSNILKKSVYLFTGDPSELTSLNLSFNLDDVNAQTTHYDLLSYIVHKSALDVDLYIYSIMTTDIWVDPETFDYKIGIIIRYKEA